MELITTYFTSLSQKQIDQFAALENLYKEWNEKINVISRKDMDNFYEHHVLHSLAIAAQFDFPAGYNIIDIGTGGGFPGIPLAIFFPVVNFHLVDSINKKLKVVNEVVSSIGLTNVTTQHARAEEIKVHRFDIVVSRAVAPLKDLWRWSRPLIRSTVDGPQSTVHSPQSAVKGLICLKGGDLSNEIAESGCRPFVYEIEKIFKEDFFKEKYLLHVPD